MLSRAVITDLVRHAIREDLGARGDVTTKCTVPPGLVGEGRIRTRERAVVAGLSLAEEVFRELDSSVRVRRRVREGASVAAGARVLVVQGPLGVILAGERVALNFLGRLSGIATLTRRYVQEFGRGRTQVLDTRKTTPLLRAAEKHAVRVGGGVNHRMGLYDGILIKDNHARAAGSVGRAVRLARMRRPRGWRIIAEAQSLPEVREACESGADIVLLDNLRGRALQEAVRWIRTHHSRVLIEVSGGVTPDRIREIRRLGVDRVSVGALTHSAGWTDFHMEIEPRRHG